eukprot:scaffold2759_cov57-Cyclotella_meneghiniana.AAC.1
MGHPNDAIEGGTARRNVTFCRRRMLWRQSSSFSTTLWGILPFSKVQLVFYMNRGSGRMERLLLLRGNCFVRAIFKT